MKLKIKKRKVIAIVLGIIIAFTAIFVTVRLTMYSEGKIYRLREAYRAGYLTKEDLLSIAYYFNDGREGNEQFMAEDYAPVPKEPQELGAKTVRSIQKTHYNQIQHKPLFFSSSLKQVKIEEYLGTYGENVVVYIHYAIDDPLFELDYIIDEVHFYEINPDDLLIWRKK